MTIGQRQNDTENTPFLKQCQSLGAYVAILDSPIPNKYGPRGFEGRDNRFATERGCREMSDDTREQGKAERRSEEAALSARLRRLGDRLDRDKASTQSGASSGASPSADGSAMARGMRLSSELVAAVLVGAGLGWLVDRWLGVSPLGLIVFLLLGFAAGIVNVLRAAGLAAGPGDGKT